MNKNWYRLTPDEVLKVLDTTPQGLSSDMAQKILERDGQNVLPEEPTETLFSIFIRQFTSPLLYILVIAGVIALLLGEYIDGAVIIGILLLNGIIGTFQEGKAKAALKELQKMTHTESLVVRSGVANMISSDDVVVGDIVVLRAGDKIPADARIIDAQNFSVDEAALTGESTTVGKNAEAIDRDAVAVADQTNMVFKGTHVARGTAKAVVIATGSTTEIGKISQHIQTIDTDIPLKRNLVALSKIIIIGVILSIGAVFTIGVLSGYDTREMFFTSLSLLVSVVPEGLPVVMTLVLALGVRRMADQKALVKRLQAVEALAHTNVLAVDKTGTLTRNEMVIEEIFVGDDFYYVTGEGYNPAGEVQQDGMRVDDITPVQYATYLSAISANAELHKEGERYTVSGDPTEAALLVLGEKLGHRKADILHQSPLVKELPFSHEKKYYVNVHQLDGEPGMIAAGAPDVLIDVCSSYWHPEGNYKLDDAKRAELTDRVTEMAGRGLRVLALVSRTDIDDADIDYEDVTDMNFVALYGMRDGLRAEIPESVRMTQGAGMRLVMITGDHKDTAAAIARQAGILRDGDTVVTGTEIAEMTTDELAEILPSVRVFARVSPDMKLEIIKAYRATGDTIAMTGDGVNDVPPLLAADLGVAMGGIGTEVTKEAADIVLLDDNFATITKAVEEGRHIFNTIQRVLVYLFSTNLAELLVIMIAVIALLPVPMTPAQIIWLNLVTDTFLVMALAFQKKEKGLLVRPFSTPPKYILDKADFIRLLLFGGIMALGTFGVFMMYQSDIVLARTMVLVTLGMFQIFRLWSIRSDTKSLFTENPLRFPLLIAMSALAVGLLLAVVYIPVLDIIFETAWLSARDWGIAIGVAFSIVIIDEVRKIFVRRR